MSIALLPLALLAATAAAAAAPDDAAQDTLQSWIELCETSSSQMGVTACQIVENAKAGDAIGAVIAEVAEAYADSDEDQGEQYIAGLRAAQAGWEKQMKADTDALFPLVPGEHESVTYGSGYLARLEYLRASLRRQRLEFLCEAWLPPQMRRERAPDEPPSACAGAAPGNAFATPATRN